MKKTEKAAKRQLTFIIVVAVIVSLVSFAAAFSVSRSKNSSQHARCEGTCVALREDKADPDTISVKVGTYVQFNSADGKTHNLSLGGGGEEHSHKGKFSSGDFKGDEAWRVQFKDEGSYVFHDHYNPKLNVLVVVYTPGKEYKVE